MCLIVPPQMDNPLNDFNFACLIQELETVLDSGVPGIVAGPLQERWCW